MNKAKSTLCMPTGCTTKAWILGKVIGVTLAILDFTLIKILMHGVVNAKTTILAMYYRTGMLKPTLYAHKQPAQVAQTI